MWLFILCFVIVGIYVVIKLNGNNVTDINSSSPTPSEIRPVKVNSNDEIPGNSNIKATVEYFRPYWRWMTLAGGTDPLLYPMISFSSDGTVCMTKHGYDLWTGNWKAYKAATSRDEKERALAQFTKDLFEENADKVNFNMEYIADHLIKFEDCSAYTSDFTTTFSFPGNFKTGDERYQFIGELKNTNIFEMDS